MSLFLALSNSIRNEQPPLHSHEKAANYFELELRVIPLKPHRLYATADDFIPFLDDSVCLCSAVAGTTYTGHFDDVAGISAALEEYNARTGSEIGLHLDSASGGFPTAVLFPELKADFRSK